MSWYSRIVAGWRAWRRRDDTEQDLDDELASYLEAARDAHRRLGLGLRDAERAARLDVGSVEAVKDYTRDVGWESTASAFVQDVRDALRRLRHSPAFTIGAVVTLALAVGANLAIFTLIDRILLHPLDVRDPDQLFVFERTMVIGGEATPLSDTWWSNADRLRHMSTVAGAAVVTRATDRATRHLVIAGPDDQAEETVDGRFVSANFFRVLGVEMALGSDFAAQQDDPRAPPAAVLGSAFWRRRFGADPTIVGRTMTVNGVPTTIVGVAPPTFADVWVGTNPPALFLPVLAGSRLATDPGAKPAGETSPTAPAVTPLSAFTVIARVAAGRERLVRAELEVLRNSGTFDVRVPDEVWSIVPLADVVLPGGIRSSHTRDTQVDVRTFVWWLAAAVALTLLIGCANLAGLMLARVEGRRPELAIRAALGASRGRLVQPIIVEAGLLVASGGMVAALVAQAIERSLATFVLPDGVAIAALRADDSGHLGLAVVMMIAAAVVMCMPAARAVGADPTPGMQGQRGATRRLRATRLCVATQAAISVVLVFGAVLFSRTMTKALTMDLGFDPHHLLSVSLSVQGGDWRAGATAADAFAERARHLPGVTDAAAGEAPIVDDLGFAVLQVQADGVPVTLPVPPDDVNVSDEYFQTLRQAVLRGRGFDDRDGPKARRVTVVSASLARLLWPNDDALGHQVSFQGNTMVVVGVAADVALHHLHDTAPLVIYRPMSQNPYFLVVYSRFHYGVTRAIVRTSGDSRPVVPMLKAAAAATGSRLDSVRSVDSAIASLLLPQRLGRELLTLLAALALVLTLIGAYSLVSSIVSRDRKEIGVRLALGARRGHIVREIMIRTVAPIAAGVTVGVLLVWWGGRFADRFLYGLYGDDATTTAIAVVAIIVGGVFAAVAPMRRALRIDPIETLRSE
ncbi:MAG TPA: ABC transporter permease [Vicinamibacterales bacterium]|nr:ABC transporter permease [Vicinamibacterales bacterium]